MKSEPGKPYSVHEKEKTRNLKELGINLTGFWRLCEIHRLISEKTYPNCNTLANRFEVTRRTIERDMDRLRDLFAAPIEYDKKHRGYYYSRQFHLPPMQLKEGEAIALFLGQKILMQCLGTPFEEFMRQAMAKVRVSLSQPMEVNLERAINSVSFHVDPLRGQESLIEKCFQTLFRAIQETKCVEMEYFSLSKGETALRRIDPYHLHFADGVWYCIGFCHTRGQVRTFALDRIKRISLTEETFVCPSDFSLEEYLGSSWVLERGEPTKVVIEFDATEARYVEGRTWHPSQVMETLDDGSLRFQVYVGSMGEIMRWVMSFGSHARVLEPEELRLKIAEEFRKGARIYAAGS